MDKNKIVYYIATVLISVMMLGGAGMYLFNHAEVAKVFESLGYPTYIICPLAAAKVLGIIAIWSNFNKPLKEWAYAGLFYDFVLAVAAHISVGDGEFIPASVAMVLLAISYSFWKRSDNFAKPIEV